MREKQAPLIIFLHIPKTAGISLMRLLWRKQLLRSPSSWFHPTLALGHAGPTDSTTRLKKLQTTTQADRARVRLLHGHHGYGLHELFTQPYHYITLLRDPVQRVVSSYFYQHSRGGIPADMMLEDYLANHRPQGDFLVENAQTRYLAGEHGIPDMSPAGADSEAMLEKAKARVDDERMTVGLVERFDESMALLAHQFGWSTPLYRVENPGKPRQARSRAVNKRAERLAREVNDLDLRLYEYVRTRFDKRLVESESADLIQLRLERLRQWNPLLSRLTSTTDTLIKTGGRLVRGLGR